MLHWLPAIIFLVAGSLLVYRTQDGAGDGPARLFVGLGSAIAASGGVLSLLHQLANPVSWSVAGCVIAAIASRLPRQAVSQPDSSTPSAPRWSLSQRITTLLLGATAVIAAIANAIMIAGTAPGAWDALTYHLPRMALALQNGAYWGGEVNFWAQLAHPIYSTALFVFSAVISGNNEHVTAFWQFAAALVASGSVLRLARLSGAPPAAAWPAALLFFVLPQTIVQGAIVANDLLLAAVTGFAAERILRFARDGRRQHLVWIALAIGLGLGMKLSFLCQIGMLAVVATLAVPARKRLLAPLAIAFAAGILFALPSGYVSNLQRWGSTVGPPEARDIHTFGNRSLGMRARETAVNTIRFATDFASLDGMPRVSTVVVAQHELRRAVMAPLDAVGLDLSTPPGVPGTFIRDRPAFALEFHSYWGIAGLLLIVPAVVMRALSRRERTAWSLAWGVFCFLLLQAASGPYDQFRGRYFLSAATLATPVAAAWFLNDGRLRRAYVLVAVTLAAITGVSSALLRTGAPLITVRYGGSEHRSILSWDRADQLARNRREYAPAIRAFEAAVPSNATVALALPPDSFEYPFFGPRLQRIVVPVGQDNPVEAAPGHVLAFSDRRKTPRQGDVHLGADWWLSGSTTPSSGSTQLR
jgi:hypothetical protein